VNCVSVRGWGVLGLQVLPVALNGLSPVGGAADTWSEPSLAVRDTEQWFVFQVVSSGSVDDFAVGILPRIGAVLVNALGDERCGHAVQVCPPEAVS
jgi:hypothetical protein